MFDVELLDSVESAQVVARVAALRDQWTARPFGKGRFFTLGAPCYLDEGAVYQAAVQRTRGPLTEAFGGLHARIRAALSARLEAPVVQADGLGVPGFHIWEGDSVPKTASASLHFDLQYMRLLGAGAAAKPGISFTLALELPRLGGGLDWWDVEWPRWAHFKKKVGPAVNLEDLPILLPGHHHPYAVGRMCVHSGHTLHQIAPVETASAEELRVTLQGHAFLNDGTWETYW